MNNRFYLIQRGSFRDLDTATTFLGGSSAHLINPDYMGAAEFEWGAIPKAYRRILGQYAEYSLHVTDLVTTGGVPFCLYCRDDRYEVILEAIKYYLKVHYRTKEWTNLSCHFKPLPEDADEWSKDHRKYELKTNFWWCIDVASKELKNSWDNPVGDWVAFTGAQDRQDAFLRVISMDYNSWWINKPEEDRIKEFEDAFHRF